MQPGQLVRITEETGWGLSLFVCTYPSVLHQLVHHLDCCCCPLKSRHFWGHRKKSLTKSGKPVLTTLFSASSAKSRKILTSLIPNDFAGTQAECHCCTPFPKHAQDYCYCKCCKANPRDMIILITPSKT